MPRKRAPKDHRPSWFKKLQESKYITIIHANTPVELALLEEVGEDKYPYKERITVEEFDRRYKSNAD